MFEINEETINVCKEAFQRFVGSGMYVGLFLISVLYIVSYMKSTDKKEKKIKLIFGIYSIIVLILNLNPFFVRFLTKALSESETYWRVYWLLPIGINIAFLFTEMIFKKEKIKDKIVLFILIILTIILSGEYIYSSEAVEKFAKVNNYYKVPDNVLDIIVHVSDDDSEYKKIAGPEVFMVYTRQIDGNILIVEERSTVGKYSTINVISEGNLESICETCTSKECNYLVLPKNIVLTEEYLLKYDIKKLYENDEYILYKFNRVFGGNDS